MIMANPFSRRKFLKGMAVIGASALVVTPTLASTLGNESLNEKTVRLYKKAVANDSHENTEELFSHLLKYPEVTNIEKLRKYWRLDKDKLQIISSSLGNHISELNGIVPVIIARMFLCTESKYIDEKHVLSWDLFITKHQNAIIKA